MTTTTRPAAEAISDAVMAWDGVRADWGSRGELSFKHGKREIGHLHGDRVLHIGFPRALWQELFDAGRIDYHPVFPGKPGFGARDLRTQDDVDDAVALMRLNYMRFRRPVVASSSLPATSRSGVGQ